MGMSKEQLAQAFQNLGGWLAAVQPDVLAVSCSVPMFIPGALRSAEAAADAGVSAVIGGRGLGADPRRGRALGLRWAASAAGLTGALLGPAPVVNQDDLAGRRGEADLLASSAERSVEAVVQALRETGPDVNEYTELQLVHTRRDLRYILQFLASSVLCDDPELFTEFTWWLAIVLTNRGLPPDVLPAGLRALAATLSPAFPRARSTLQQATEIG